MFKILDLLGYERYLSNRGSKTCKFSLEIFKRELFRTFVTAQVPMK